MKSLGSLGSDHGGYGQLSTPVLRRFLAEWPVFLRKSEHNLLDGEK
jgi:hypothetical protein